MSSCYSLINDVDNYCVVGSPIKHSLSPRIHNLFAQQTSQSISYQAYEIEDGKFNEFLQSFISQGGKGFNITVPYKTIAYEVADTLSQRAEKAGAVNTISIVDDQAQADNTDGIGLVRDIRENLETPVHDSRMLLLGAGGAVRGVLGALSSEFPRHVVIANRTVEKAITLAKVFDDELSISAMGFSDLTQEPPFDIVINGTASSLQRQSLPVPVSVFSKSTLSYDMMYSTEPTAFQQWSYENGVTRAVDGLGMLIEQAAEAFYLWRGIRPNTQAVFKSLRPA